MDALGDNLRRQVGCRCLVIDPVEQPVDDIAFAIERRPAEVSNAVRFQKNPPVKSRRIAHEALVLTKGRDVENSTAQTRIAAPVVVFVAAAELFLGGSIVQSVDRQPEIVPPAGEPTGK